mmetsp:Transcript_39268/g.90448  ORF Transcript_39268/g.90448 Transcript_39268/m.90448 type:complete len:294 (-) Transcript_39268:742-1623(-)
MLPALRLPLEMSIPLTVLRSGSRRRNLLFLGEGGSAMGYAARMRFHMLSIELHVILRPSISRTPWVNFRRESLFGGWRMLTPGPAVPYSNGSNPMSSAGIPSAPGVLRSGSMFMAPKQEVSTSSGSLVWSRGIRPERTAHSQMDCEMISRSSSFVTVSGTFRSSRSPPVSRFRGATGLFGLRARPRPPGPADLGRIRVFPPLASPGAVCVCAWAWAWECEWLQWEWSEWECALESDVVDRARAEAGREALPVRDEPIDEVARPPPPAGDGDADCHPSERPRESQSPCCCVCWY